MEHDSPCNGYRPRPDPISVFEGCEGGYQQHALVHQVLHRARVIEPAKIRSEDRHGTKSFEKSPRREPYRSIKLLGFTRIIRFVRYGFILHFLDPSNEHVERFLTCRGFGTNQPRCIE